MKNQATGEERTTQSDSRGEFQVASVAVGVYRLEVRAASGDGSWESEPAAITVPFDGQLPEPDLYVVAVGINRFAREIKKTS